MMKSYSVETDKYHNVLRLNLFQFNGAPIQPLYLVYNPPQMLPTQTLNPTRAPTATGKVKREQVALNGREERVGKGMRRVEKEIEPDHVWWVGIVMVMAGSAMYMMPERTK